MKKRDTKQLNREYLKKLQAYETKLLSNLILNKPKKS